MFRSGNAIVAFPAGGRVGRVQLRDKSAAYLSRGNAHTSVHAVLGLASSGAGRVAVYGDSNCMDSSHKQGSDCFWLLRDMVRYGSTGALSLTLESMTEELAADDPLVVGQPVLPLRRDDQSMMRQASKVVSPGAQAGASCPPKDGRGVPR